MKAIMGKGTVGLYRSRWLALVPDNATSSGDPRRFGEVIAPRDFDVAGQTIWLEGYAAAITHINKKQRELQQQCVAIGLLPSPEGGGA